ncbi:MAG: peptidoglycan-binding domain-containing protein, partial [Methanoregula sp.]
KYRSISRATPRILQRDLALTLPEELPDQPELTDAQVQAAIRYNSASYREDSIRLIQDLVGAGQTGSFDETTVRLVAKIQSDFGLVPVDGKVGPDTYNLLIRELQAEGTTPGTCLTLFQLIGPEPLTFFRNSPTSGTIGSRFFIKARFDPRCNCGDFEYRQYIAGNVELHDVAGPVFNLNSRFAVPGGLPATLTEDGDSTIPAGNALHNYGHRSFIGNPNCDQYLPDRRTGCEYESCDFPELTPIPAAVGDTGDRYEWIMRFRGTINRKGQGVVEEKYWAIRGTIVLPHP